MSLIAQLEKETRVFAMRGTWQNCFQVTPQHVYKMAAVKQPSIPFRLAGAIRFRSRMNWLPGFEKPNRFRFGKNRATGGAVPPKIAVDFDASRTKSRSMHP